MPRKLAGFGSGYSGEFDQETHFTKCRFCGFRGDLVSYTTNEVLYTLFIPLAPLGKKKIIDRCPNCGKHHVIGLKTIHRRIREELEPAKLEYVRDRSDKDLGRKVLQLCIDLQAHDTFSDLASDYFENTFMQDGPGLALLGKGYLYFGYTDASEEAYRSSRAMKGANEVGRELAVVLMKKHRPVEAIRYLKHIFQTKDQEHLDLLELLVESLQAEGKHNDALNVFDDIQRDFPQLAKQDWYKERRPFSEENLGSDARLPSRSFPADGQ